MDPSATDASKHTLQFPQKLYPLSFFIFPPLKDSSIIGLHRQSQNDVKMLVLVTIALLVLGCTLHGLGAYNVFVANSA